MNNFDNLNNFLIHEFLGMPRTRKSSIIKALAKKLKRFDFNIEIINEGTQNCPFDKGKSHFLYTQWGLKKTIQALKRIYFSSEGKTIVFVDRGPYDRFPFIRAQINYGDVTQNQGRVLCELSKKFRSYIDSVSLHLCLPATVMQRERKQGRTGKGRIMNLQFLKILYQSYIEFNKNQEVPNLIIIDSEKTSSEQKTDLILSHILSLLKIRRQN